jgi:lactoylglutathione lyase
MIKFAYTILYVVDVKKSMSFYEKAFGFKSTFVTPDNTYGELATGPTTLSFASIELAKSNLKDGFVQSSIKLKPFAIEIAFATDHVDEVYKTAIKAGATADSPAQFKPQRQTVDYVRDLDGFLIEICTPMG